MSIQLQNVSKLFGGVSAVHHVSFQVKEGELVALLGPSGCGKTTVLRMIAGLEQPTEGAIFVRGRRVNDIPVQKRNIGFVFQAYALFRHMTVRENIAFGLKVKKWRRADREVRVADLVRLLKLEGLEHRYPHQLSGGQRQRVAIARALAPKPDVLLLDEPFAAVDARIRQELREWLVHLQHDLGVTMLFVTHDQEEAMEIADRIVIFSRGHIEQIASPREVYENPATEFVARFIGVMNVLEAEAHQGVARRGELEFPAPGVPDGARVRVGFRPYGVRVSPDPAALRYRGVIQHTFFLGLMMRVEIELISGLLVRARLTKEDYSRLGLAEGMEVSFEIRQYRILAGEDAPLEPEMNVL